MGEIDMKNDDSPFGPCPLGRAAGVLGDRWTMLIMRNAMLGTTRFDEFKSRLGIADNILSNRLSRLVDAGLLTKVPYLDVNRTRERYALTGAGAGLRPVLQSLAEWGHTYVNPDEPSGAVTVIHHTCGETTTDGRYCAACQRPVPYDETAWMMPWLSETPQPLAEVHGTP
ncbi:DNA-binding HxlR family transcriptional regulator [Rhodococcus sp. 27YEA15]|uniref:winged helix-turn-helix transcriptional regulator n=1 Tax=Rhodococcus sp. 27YEA15 TaxID=3156259 RepID=UPI003C7B2ABF